MGKVILAINAGSSSVKVSVFKYGSPTDQPEELAVIQVAGLTAPPATLKYDRGDQHLKNQELKDINSQEGAYQYILKHLTEDSGLAELQHPDDIEFVCHRIVHGGDYDRPTRIDKDTYQHLEELSDLAPLHNAGALTIVKAVHTNCPKATNIAFFDSAFHSTIPTATRTYAIDPDIAQKNKLRRYGFHGLSYSFITRSVAAYLSKPPSQLNIIALHLGSGASACAIQDGKSIDTSMGLTPLAGLPGATRSGSVDPSLIFHFTHEAGKPSRSSSKELHITQAEEILNKKSGWGAMTGTTDMGEIIGRMDKGDEKARLAFEVFIEAILGFVGSYFVKLGGKVDALVFAGGIGEKGTRLREVIGERVKCLGFEIDGKLNQSPEDKVVSAISKSGAKQQVLICQTDEQVEMARQCVKSADELRRPA